jgi:hypothetical protein
MLRNLIRSIKKQIVGLDLNDILESTETACHRVAGHLFANPRVKDFFELNKDQPSDKALQDCQDLLFAGAGDFLTNQLPDMRIVPKGPAAVVNDYFRRHSYGRVGRLVEVRSMYHITQIDPIPEPYASYLAMMSAKTREDRDLIASCRPLVPHFIRTEWPSISEYVEVFLALLSKRQQLGLNPPRLPEVSSAFVYGYLDCITPIIQALLPQDRELHQRCIRYAREHFQAT